MAEARYAIPWLRFRFLAVFLLLSEMAGGFSGVVTVSEPEGSTDDVDVGTAGIEGFVAESGGMPSAGIVAGQRLH
jgi:hypothetical protein